MRSRDELIRATAPESAGAGFRAEREGGFATITPLTDAAASWLHANVDDEASWTGDTLVVEIRYFPGLADAAIDAGYTFERDSYPN